MRRLRPCASRAIGGERWMTVRLSGEIVGGSFERGISQYPSVNDEVHLVTEEDLAHVLRKQPIVAKL